MANGLFREKSLERIASPEQLDDYIRTVRPGGWALLAGLFLLLAGAFVWGIFGRLETSFETGAACRDGVLICYIPEEKAPELSAVLEVRAEGRSYPAAAVSEIPRQLPASADAYALHLGGLSVGDWVYTAELETDLPDGAYQVAIVTERIAPISLIFNRRAG